MNAKVAKTRKALLDALIAMLEEEPIESISVSRLCQRANINRTTFYKYYSVPVDVMLEAVEEIFRQTILPQEATVYEHLLAACNAFYENRKLVMLYTRSTGNLYQLFYTVLMRHSGELDFLGAVETQFLAGGVTSTLSAWMIRGFPESPAEMARILTGFIEKIIDQETVL